MTAMPLVPVRGIGRRRVVNRQVELLRRCAGKRVLHLGCADHPFTDQRDGQLLHAQLERVVSDLWGVDQSAEGIAALITRGFSSLVVTDVERLEPTQFPGRFDVIVAGELIEHLANPGAFLQAVKLLMGPETELVLTTPNASAAKVFLRALLGGEKVHPEHQCYFSYFTIAQALERAGLEPQEIAYYQDVEGRGASAMLDGALAVIPRLAPALADGLIVRARLTTEGVDNGQRHDA